MSPTIRDAFRLAQNHGVQGLSHVNQPGKPIPIVQEGVMMVHQVLSEEAQRSEALIRDTLRPEDNPRVIPKGEGDDGEPEQTAPLEVRLTACRRPHGRGPSPRRRDWAVRCARRGGGAGRGRALLPAPCSLLFPARSHLRVRELQQRGLLGSGLGAWSGLTGETPAASPAVSGTFPGL